MKQIYGYKFRRQVPIGKFIADFVCHEARLIIEIDGGQHELSSEREISRTSFINKQGYCVLRFWNNEVIENLEGVYAVIELRLQQGAQVSLDHDHPHPTLPHQGGGL
jgi:very-short-patch-repair endonuclease